jgi:hypothetical protein
MTLLGEVALTVLPTLVVGVFVVAMAWWLEPRKRK